MPESSLQVLASGIAAGQIVPYLGPGALKSASNVETGEPIPADSDSLILAMNNGKPMAPRLMYEFPRAAMDVELKRGRAALHRFLESIYSTTQWTRAPIHDWLAGIKPPYVIDINRDTQLQDSYADTPHTLIRGIARVGGTDYRFRIHHYDGETYSENEIAQDEVDTSVPILFKPMGSPKPDPTYIASDADYVDYITELMGGFAIPDFVKKYRIGKQYLFIGLRMTRDTERMVLSDMIYAASEPKGWALIPAPNDKERRFCKRLGIEIIESDVEDLLAAAAETFAEGAA
ncbi:MAG: SIR2 family protein [Candidatus Thiodiazotropha endolucinida]|uniref:SIR2 family protein n=1 Tax=Candidatus Thiodiazotropha taylori TaxID=2792791 RepID=A0A9E4TSQ4_9GAMM|nr:SIR2 family protein [Candidatus Thiodiazotropha taylori]MCW4236080.1 SIR2 family protein [Candidatus Thiodiazotropha endolucinida]